MKYVLIPLLLLLVYAPVSVSVGAQNSFNRASYEEANFDRDSKAKVESVLQQRKDAGVPSKLGFSYNTKPGQKIQVAAEFISCSPLSKGNSNFWRTGLKMKVLPTALKDLVKEQCSFRIGGKEQTLFAQATVAEYMMAVSKESPILIGKAYLLYLGVSNAKAEFVLNDFKPKSQ